MNFQSSLFNLLPLEIIKKYEVIPLAEAKQTIIVGMKEPFDLEAIDDLSLLTGRTVIPKPMAIEEIQLGLKRYLLDDSGYAHIGERIFSEKIKFDNQIGGLVDSILTKAVKEKASDIHFEPEERGWRVRFRIDGILVELVKPQVDNYAGIISRLKILAGLDISKKREPLEGRFQQQINGKSYDFRLVTMPALYGEKAVIRVLDKETIGFALNKLGFSKENLKKVKKLLTHPQGLTLVTGPTGSGKTTTLYAILQELNSSGRSVTTLEDPVEYTMPGITQVAISADNGLNYVDGLKALLRQDPDIIMIGEIRDTDTARIALRAAVTGHFVLATVHTNNAPQAISRLLDLEVEPHLIKSGLIGIISQRLLRLSCQCTGGCSRCNFTGYSSRTSIQEVLEITLPLALEIRNGFDETEFIAKAAREGYFPLLEAGKQLCRQGVTDLKELARVIYCP